MPVGVPDLDVAVQPQIGRELLRHDPTTAHVDVDLADGDTPAGGVESDTSYGALHCGRPPTMTTARSPK
jgi:hypothetical protein